MIATMTPYLANRMNCGAAALNRQKLADAGVAAITLCGGPGCGKTALLLETLKRINGDLRVGVILGNIRADRDESQLHGWCAQVAAFETVDLNASLVRDALEQLDLSKLDLIFIERASAAPPTPSDLGQSATVGMFSVSGGDDKVLRYPERVENADLVLLTKADLLSIVPFNERQFREAITAVRSDVDVLAVSVVSHSGITAWCEWVREQVRKNSGAKRAPVSKLRGDYFFG